VEKATSKPDEGYGAEVKFEKANPFDDRKGDERDYGIATVIASHVDVAVVIERPMRTQHDDDGVGCRATVRVNHVAFA
jgi:hypothetical protein